MTLTELKKKLYEMSDLEFAEFKQKFGKGGNSREWYIDYFVQNPSHERKLCHLLGIATEEERVNQAVIESAEASRASAAAAAESARYARHSRNTTIGALVIAALVFILSLFEITGCASVLWDAVMTE